VIRTPQTNTSWTVTARSVASGGLRTHQVVQGAVQRTAVTGRPDYVPGCQPQRVRRDCAVTPARHSRGVTVRLTTGLDLSAVSGATADSHGLRATPTRQQAATLLLQTLQTWVSSVWMWSGGVDVKQRLVEMDQDDCDLQTHTAQSFTHATCTYIILFIVLCLSIVLLFFLLSIYSKISYYSINICCICCCNLYGTLYQLY